MYQPDAPDLEYAFQIMPEEKSGWYLDSMFFARGTKDRDLWAVDVQIF